jgi:hypothetical protein
MARAEMRTSGDDRSPIEAASFRRKRVGLTHSHYAGLAIDFLFGRPVFASTHFVEGSEIPRPTALRFLALLREAEILRVLREGAGRRAAIYAFPTLLNIAEGRHVLESHPFTATRVASHDRASVRRKSRCDEPMRRNGMSVPY